MSKYEKQVAKIEFVLTNVFLFDLNTKFCEFIGSSGYRIKRKPSTTA